MKTSEITNKNVLYYVDSIALPVNATVEDINDALDNAEMDISINWGEGIEPAFYNVLHFDYNSPDTREVGDTSLVGYLDLKGYCKEYNLSLKYTDAWGVVQDKIPLIIHAYVCEREED